MKIQRSTGVNGVNERTAKGLQLTRVVPPSISVPFWVGTLGVFLLILQELMKYRQNAFSIP